MWCYENNRTLTREVHEGGGIEWMTKLLTSGEFLSGDYIDTTIDIIFPHINFPIVAGWTNSGEVGRTVPDRWLAVRTESAAAFQHKPKEPDYQTEDSVICSLFNNWVKKSLIEWSANLKSRGHRLQAVQSLFALIWTGLYTTTHIPGGFFDGHTNRLPVRPPCVGECGT